MKKLLKKGRNTRSRRAGDWQWIDSIQSEAQSERQEKKRGNPKSKVPVIRF